MNDCTKTVSLKDSMNYDLILFFDCEYTCWENSLKTLWSDPQYPSELLQIGIAVYNIKEKKYFFKAMRCLNDDGSQSSSHQ